MTLCKPEGWFSKGSHSVRLRVWRGPVCGLNPCRETIKNLKTVVGIRTWPIHTNEKAYHLKELALSTQENPCG